MELVESPVSTFQSASCTPSLALALTTFKWEECQDLTATLPVSHPRRLTSLPGNLGARWISPKIHGEVPDLSSLGPAG